VTRTRHADDPTAVEEGCPSTFDEYATVDGWLGEAHHRCVRSGAHYLSPHVCKCGTEWREGQS
jgi:hypothetical protein